MDDVTDWLQQNYLDRHALLAISQAYRSSQSVQLRSFLDAGMFRKLQQQALSTTKKRKSAPDRHIYDVLKPKGRMQSFENFLHSSSCSMLVSFFAGTKMTCQSIEWLSFGHRQYSILHDKMEQEPGLYMVMDFTPWNQEWGGFTSVVKGDEEQVRIEPQPNTATFFTFEDARYFTKYVNHRAKDKRRVLMMAIFK